MTQKNSVEKVFDLVHPLYQHDYNQLGVPIKDKVTEDQLEFANVRKFSLRRFFST